MRIQHLTWALGLVLAACNDDEPSESADDTSDTISETVTVTVSPATAEVRVDARQTFQASVIGTSDIGVTWTVDGAGTIDASGVYTAPSTVPAPDEVTVRATSDADPSAFDEALVTVLPAEQLPVEPWVLLVSGSGGDGGLDVVPLADGGFIACGDSSSQGQGSNDGWLLRLDAEGAVVWQTLVGEEGNQAFLRVVPLADGGFLALGVFARPSETYGDMWLVRFTADGSVVDERTLGGDGWTFQPRDAAVRSDGDIVVVGDVWHGTDPARPAFVMRLDAAGDVQELRSFGDSEYGFAIARGVTGLADGGVAVAGTIADPAHLAYGDQAWLLVLDADLEPVLSVAYGSSFERPDWGSAVAQTDDGFVFAGVTYSWGEGSSDGWLLGLDTTGGIRWQKAYGDSTTETFEDLVTTEDGGAIAVGDHGPGWMVAVDSEGVALDVQDVGGMRYAIEAVPSGGWVTAGNRQYGSDSQLMIQRLDEDHTIPECVRLREETTTTTVTEAMRTEVGVSSPTLGGSWQTITSTVTDASMPTELECAD